MKLRDVLLEKKPAILRKWFDAILETYPPDTSNFLKNQKNQFANPVGATISHELENIFNELLQGLPQDNVSAFLDNIIRIRAVQDFIPSQSLSFIFSLKKIIREVLDKEIKENQISDELFAFESLIDKLALVSFDIYMKCREKLYDIKANEVKSMTFRLLQRANLICEVQEENQDIKDNNFMNIKRKEATK